MPASSDGQQQKRMTVSGVRISAGDAVDCPTIKADDGTIHAVSSLPTSVPIGGKVEVTGFMARIPTCRGQVLYAEETRILEQD